MPRTLCLRRQQLYQDHLDRVKQRLKVVLAAKPRVYPALGPEELKVLMHALAEILDAYVIHGVARDLERLKPSKVLFLDETRTKVFPTLDHFFFSKFVGGLGYTGADAKLDPRITPQAAYRRYFAWYIGPAKVRQKGRELSGVEAFYERYPLLAHAVKTAAEHYAANIELACDRVLKDWNDIQTAFFSGKTLKNLARIKTTGNDFHKGGKQVLILTFELTDGKLGRVVYKPSAVEIDCRLVGDSAVFTKVEPEKYKAGKSLTEILNELNPARPRPGRFKSRPLPTYVILPYQRGSVVNAYGYIEFLSHEPDLSIGRGDHHLIPRRVAEAVVAAQQHKDVVAGSDWIVTDSGDAQVFCYQLGALMGMALAVSLCDLHVQNAIVHKRLPHLIDLEEALKRPMGTIAETYLHKVAEEYEDSVGTELEISGDLSSDLTVKRSSVEAQPATCTLYRYDGKDLFRVNVVGGDERPGGDRDASIWRSALVCGLTDLIDVLAGDAGNQAVKKWVGELTGTIARFVPSGTANYLRQSRDLFEQCYASSVPNPLAPAEYREFKTGSGQPFFVRAARARRSDWEGKAKDVAKWNPLFAVEHPDHAWRDYLNGDVPSFYHILGSRDLLNSEEKVVDVAAVSAWQETHLGLEPWPQKLDKEYFPMAPVAMIAAQLDALKNACATPDGKREYLKQITAGIRWLETGSPVRALLPRLNRKTSVPFDNPDMRSLGDLVSDFMELPPLPAYAGKEEPALPSDKLPARKIELIKPSAPPSRPSAAPPAFAYAEELKAYKIRYDRVVAYGFRGDSRGPLEFRIAIKDPKTDKVRFQSMQGFLPNYTWPDHIDKLANNPNAFLLMDAHGKPRSKEEVEKSALDLQTYLANQFMGGYISLSRDAMVARSFACGMGGTRERSPGWVYCALAEGAFSVEQPSAGPPDPLIKNEAELAMPGMLDWQDIVGFRRVTKDGTFTGPAYLRGSLQKADRDAFTRLYQILSGKRQ